MKSEIRTPVTSLPPSQHRERDTALSVSSSLDDASARGASACPQGPPALLEVSPWFLFPHSCLGKISSSSLPLSAEVRGDQSKRKGWKKQTKEGGENTHVATTENLLKHLCETQTLWGTLSDSGKDRRWEKKGTIKKNYTENSLARRQEGGFVPGCSSAPITAAVLSRAYHSV